MILTCFHLYNDFSGSPKVLSSILENIANNDCDIDIITSYGEGALSHLSTHNNIHIHTYRYKFSDNPLVTLFRYSLIQIYIFFYAFKYLKKKDCVFYINTILPIGAALAGKIMGKRVIYHYHENAFAKGSIYKILAMCMQRIAKIIICVSSYQRSFLTRKKGIIIVPNAVPTTFIKKLTPSPDEAFERKSILMLGSLKKYKGTDDFIALAQMLPEYKFTLVLNEESAVVKEYINKNNLSDTDNITLFPRQSDVATFYNKASIVLNLTNKDKAIETFGLTALEAMSNALPVIVPTVGGIAEIVEDGVNGYKIDVVDTESIIQHIKMILSDKSLYLKLASGAYSTATRFNEKSMAEDIFNILL